MTEASHPEPPPMLTRFLGREQEVEQVRALISRVDVRLVTLSGPGGVGKTRLALQVLRGEAINYDGVTFVTLAPVQDWRVVPAVIGQALGIRNATASTLLDRLAAIVGDHSHLLVIDNFEHVIDASPLLTDLLTSAPRLKLLVTSRVMLRLSGEHAYPLSPLSLPPRNGGGSVTDVISASAVKLFVERASTAQPGFALDHSNVQAVVRICRQLDGLPLAIELAAARCRVLSPQAVLDRLDHQLALLTRGPRDGPLRHQTMRNAISWSYDLLGAGEQVLFNRLAIFMGGWSLGAARIVAADSALPDPELLDGLTTLVEASLIFREQGNASEPRFGMLETIRAFGLEQLTANGELVTTQVRHAVWCLELVERAWPLRSTAFAGPHALAQLDLEQDNIRAALASALSPNDVETGVRLAASLSDYWCLRGNFIEGRNWLAQALDLDVHLPELRMVALFGAATLAVFQGDLAAAIPLANDCLDAAQAHGDDLDLIQARFLVGLCMADGADLLQATDYARRTLEIANQAGDAGWIGYATILLARHMYDLGDYTQAAQLSAEAHHCFVGSDNRWGELNALVGWAGTLLAQDVRDESALLYEQVVALSRELDSQWEIVEAAIALAALTVTADVAVASRLLRIARQLEHSMGLALRFPLLTLQNRLQEVIGNRSDENDPDELPFLTLDQVFEEVTAAAQIAVSHAAKPPRNERSPLTAREHEVLQLVTQRYSSPEIAVSLFIGTRTVERHLDNIFNKLGVNNRRDAAREASRRNLV